MGLPPGNKACHTTYLAPRQVVHRTDAISRSLSVKDYGARPSLNPVQEGQESAMLRITKEKLQVTAFFDKLLDDA